MKLEFLLELYFLLGVFLNEMNFSFLFFLLPSLLLFRVTFISLSQVLVAARGIITQNLVVECEM